MRFPAAKLMGNVGPGTRAAIIAGVTAGITVSLMLMGGHGSVTVHNTAADAPVDETTSTMPETTSTTLAPATTTTVLPETTTTTLSVEQRLARIEATTTTTTTYPPVPPSIAVSSGTLTPDGWQQTILYYNHIEVAAKFPNPVMHYSYIDDAGVNHSDQVAIPPQQTPDGLGRITVLVPGVTHQPVFTASNADITWDGK